MVVRKTMPAPKYPEAKVRAWLAAKKIYGTRLSTAQIAGAGHNEFYGLARLLCRSWSKRLIRGNEVVAVETHCHSANGWAISVPEISSGMHLVVATRGLIDRLSMLGGQEMLNLRAWFNTPEAQPLLNLIWSGLPKTERSAEAFAELLVHASFVFLLHHELAHISLGHLQLSDVLRGAPIRGARSIDESFALRSLGVRSYERSQAMYAQCLEADADVHAFQWTCVYLPEFFNAVTSWSDPCSREVWDVFCNQAERRSFLIVFAAFLFFAAVGLQSLLIGDLSAESHPPAITRLMFLLNLENARAMEGNVRGGMQTLALLHGVTLLARKAQSEALLKSIEDGTKNGDLQLTSQELYSKVVREAGIEDSLEIWQDIKEHYQQLRSKRKNLDSRLARARLFRWPGDECVWY